jgi:glycosyltransferase involved in cell wall biosynthesis
VPRRILLLITDLEIGGTPTVVRELAVRLRRPPGVEAEVACLSHWGPVADQLKTAGAHVTPLDCTRAIQFPLAVGRLVRLVRARGYDAVFSFLIHANAVAAAASRFCDGVRFLQSIQTTQPRPRWHWKLQAMIHGAAGRVVVPSPSVAQVAREWSGVPPEKIVVIWNAVDADAFERSPVPLRDDRPYPIGFIGRLDPVKRLPDLIEAVKHLDGLVHLHVFGEGPERPRIESMVDALDLRRLVTLHGAVPRPQDALKSLGLLVLPSLAEGLGLVLVEAMAGGVPAVGRNVPGVRDVIRGGVNGLLAPADGVRELADVIRRVVDDRDLRLKLIEGGRDDVRGRFSWQAVLPQYERVLGLAQGRQRCRPPT